MKATYIISTYHKPGLLFRVHGSLAQKVHMSTFPVGLGKGPIGTIFSLSTITWISAKLGTIILLFFSSQSFLDRNIFIQATAPENTTALQLHIFDQYVSLSRKFYHAPVFYRRISWTKQIDIHVEYVIHRCMVGALGLCGLCIIKLMVYIRCTRPLALIWNQFFFSLIICAGGHG